MNPGDQHPDALAAGRTGFGRDGLGTSIASGAHETGVEIATPPSSVTSPRSTKEELIVAADLPHFGDFKGGPTPSRLGLHPGRSASCSRSHRPSKA